MAPSKEAALFRQLIRYYEDKQYKRAIRSAELILKKNPRHADTIAMKALTINAQGRTEEAFALGKEALTVDMKSHICWHVYGLLYRAAKNLEEAIKAYKFALKLEPESQQIQRDLSILQIQMRDYSGYIQSRVAMLQARPHLRQNWTALAVAHHLAGSLSEAELVLTTYEGTIKTPPSRHDLEHSEAVMYKNSLIAEQGDHHRALEHLEAIADQNLDRLAVMECRAQYLAKLGRHDEAAVAYRALIRRNSDNFSYFSALAEVMRVAADDVSARKALFNDLAEEYPLSNAARRKPLDFLTGNEFREACKHYLSAMLDKGIPSTFANLKHLYSDEQKMEIMESIVLRYMEESERSSDYETSKNEAASKLDNHLKGKAAALFYLAQHHNSRFSRDLSKAMAYVNQASEILPLNVDILMTKARILKHLGHLREAADIMDYARTLDLGDRYINSKAVKYRLRNNENERALQTIAVFTRADAVGGPFADLLDMQCIWFLVEDGEAFERLNHTGLALKRFHAVYDVFDIWHDDQMDFHVFSLKKGHIRAYVEMIRWEDHLRDHPFFTRAALNAISIYLKIHDSLTLSDQNGVDKADSEGMAGKKKAAKKQRREQHRLEKEAAFAVTQQDSSKSTQPADGTRKRDDDPLGSKLAATTEPLLDAMKFITHLLPLSSKYVDAQIAGFDVYIRRNKYLLALRCLKAALILDPYHPKLHEQVIEFQHSLNTAAADGIVIALKASEVLQAESTMTSRSTDLGEYNEKFYELHNLSPPHVLSAIRARRILGQDLAGCEEQLVEMLQMPGLDFAGALVVWDTLKACGSCQVEPFRLVAKEKWPGVTRFS